MFSISRSVYYFTFSYVSNFWTSDLVFWRMVVQLHCMAFLNKMYSPRGVNFCPSISKSSGGPPFFISFLGFTYIELQVYKLLPKSECRCAPEAEEISMCKKKQCWFVTNQKHVKGWHTCFWTPSELWRVWRHWLNVNNLLDSQVCDVKSSSFLTVFLLVVGLFVTK